ncbi:hypothetical protein D3C72_1199530 [compost metagenome]
MQRVVQPLFVQIERQIGKAALDRGIAIMDFTGFKQKGISRLTLVTLAAAMELLSARKRNAHQIAVMPVWVESMAFEVCLNGFNTCVCMLT